MTFCFTLWTLRAFSQLYGCLHVRIQTQFLKIWQGEESWPWHSNIYSLLFSRLQQIKNRRKRKKKFNLRGSLEALRWSCFWLSTIYGLAIRITKADNLVLIRKQGERRWKATAVLCVVMGYHLSHGREQSPAAVAYTELTQLWMRRRRPALAQNSKSAENDWLYSSRGRKVLRTCSISAEARR